MLHLGILTFLRYKREMIDHTECRLLGASAPPPKKEEVSDELQGIFCQDGERKYIPSIVSVHVTSHSWKAHEGFVAHGTDSNKRRHRGYTLIPMRLISTKLSRG